MFSTFFIERPIFATVLAVIICLAGLVALTALPVEQYPPITPVQVTVSATYPGADSQTLADSVAAPIESQINGVDNMIYMSSTSSSNGQLLLTVYFTLNTDPDIAQVQVQNRVNLALPQLPEAVAQQGVSVQKKASSIMMLIGIYTEGERYSSQYIANYANVYVLDAIKRVPGAGQAQIMGVPDQAMRIWMNPDRMASLGITTSDIQQAVASQNALYGAGQIGQQPTAGPVELTFPVVTQRPFTKPAQYENIILRASQDASGIVRLKDVARAEVGLRQYISDSRLSGTPATFIAVYQQPGANGLEVSKAVRKTLEEMKPRFPGGLKTLVSLDTNDFVRLSIKEVVHTLFEAILLVVLVVYLFLQSFRTTVICAAAIVVALVSTFSGMLALGFSINLLTLFGLVLAIGMVVDDAIVVVENVERNMVRFHLSPKEATIRAMGEISSSLVAVVLVMASVFIPAAFLPGTTGQLYKQFAITIVISVAVSGFVALTLTPAMCGMLLKHTPPPTRGFFAWFNRGVEALTRGFGHAVTFVIKRMAVAFAVLAVLVYAIIHLFQVLPTSFVPNEDQGYVMAAIIMPDGASLNRTKDVTDRVEGIFKKIPGVDQRTQITGYSLLDSGYKTNSGTFFTTLKPFDERYGSVKKARAENARAALLNLNREAAGIREGLVIPVPPPAIPGIGTTGGFEFWIQDTGAGDPARLDELTQQFLGKARRRPELTGLNTTFRATTRQVSADVDREKASLIGVPVTDVYNAIQAQFGSLTVSQYNEFSRIWWVILQSEPKHRQDPGDLERLYTRSNQGEMVPLSALVTTRWVTGPDLLPHFNGFPAAKVNGNAAPGYSSGQAIAAMEAVGREVLPPGYTFAWSGLAYEEKKSGGTSMLAFVFGLVIVFLVLAAQYESWTLPASVLMAVPFGVLGALTANWLRGLENDVYFQIGLLVLIGLGAKNAILRVSFAVELRRQGRSIMEATIEAGQQRLRPIIMTSLAFAIGVLPLAIAMGAGANARHSIGTGIIGGMIGETTLAMLYVPLLFYLFDRLSERSQAKKKPDPVRKPRRSKTRHRMSRRDRRRAIDMRGLLVLALAVLLTGCMVGPDYVRPLVEVPAAFRYEDREAQETPNSAWWKQFQDPVLDALITEALANNRNVKIAVANLEKAAGVLVQTRSPLWPQIGYGGSGTRERSSESGTVPWPDRVANPHSAYQTLASASWEIDLWGRIRRLSESAQAELLATEEAWHGVILSLMASVATNYIQLLSLDEQLLIAQRTLATYAESVKLFELRFKYGQVSLMTVEQARSQYETAAAGIPQIESQLAQTENALAILIGRNPGPVRRGKTIHQLGLPPVPAGLPSEVLAQRPDIRQAEQNLIAANAQIGAARALYFPTISLTGTYGYASSDLSNLFNGPARVWSYAGSLTGPIFTGGAIAGQVKQAEAARKAALFSYEGTIQNAFADAENTLVARSKLVEQVQAQERLVRANSEYVRLARLQYDGGYSPYSTVLQAEQQLFPSELNYAQYRGSLFISLVNIYKAMGGGWQVAAPGTMGLPPN